MTDNLPKKKLISTKEEEEISLIELASENQDLKHRIAILLAKLENSDTNEIEEDVMPLLRNMMNFFAKYVEEIPNFDSLTPEQKKALLLRFKEIANNIAGRKIRSIEEITQVFVFTILSALGETITGAKHLTVIEIMNKKHKHSFREFLRRMATYELYKAMNPNQIAGETKEENFINNAILRGVKKALKYEGIALNENKLDPMAYKILEEAHAKFERHKKGLGAEIRF